MKKKQTSQNSNPSLASLRQAAMAPAIPPVQRIVEEPTIPEVIQEVEPVTETEPKNRYDYHDINSAPRNGTLIVVSETGMDKGEIVFWKRTRAFANATHRWEETGFFVSNITNLPILFKPKYWRNRSLYEI
jgi:hypothetical protein